MIRSTRIKTTLLLVLFFLILLGSIYFYESKEIRDGLFSAVKIVDISGHGIAETGLYYDLNHDSDTWYAFLPSMKDKKKLRITFEGCDHIEFEDINGYSISFDDYDSFSGLNPFETYYLKFIDRHGNTLTKGKFMYLQSEDIASLFVKTDPRGLEYIESSKKHRETGEILLKNENGETDYSGRLEIIKGRGNTSWNYEKKPYALKLEKKAPLLGMGVSKKWALLAGYADRSAVRDVLVRYIAEEMNMRFVPAVRYVDLYINGEYRGLYLLAEKIEAAEDKLDITDLQRKNRKANLKLPKNYTAVSENAGGPGERHGFRITNPDDITGGYIIEKNYIDRYTRFLSRFRLNNGEKYCVRSPKYASIEEVNYIAGVMQEISDRAANGEDISELADLKSFADKYLLEEFVANEASGATSSYFYKDSDKKDPHVYAGPVWDYDKCLGNAMNSEIDDPRHLTFLTAHPSATRLYYDLYNKNENYRELVRTEYINVLRPVIRKILDEDILEELSDIPSSDEMSPLRWHGNTEDIKNAAGEVHQFMEERLQFFDEVFVEEKELRFEKSPTGVLSTIP